MAQVFIAAIPIFFSLANGTPSAGNSENDSPVRSTAFEPISMKVALDRFGVDLREIAVHKTNKPDFSLFLGLRRYVQR